MPITYGDGATSRTITGVTYGDGATSRTIQEVWYGDGGTNRLVYSANAVSLSSRTIGALQIGGPSSASMDLLNTGVAQSTASPGGTTSFAPEWLSGGSSSDYEARWTNNTGSITTGTAGVWQSLSTSRSYGVSRNSAGTTSCTGTLEIRLAATGVVQATATITVEAVWG